MLKKSLYLYAMMIFSLTALQATEELPSELTEQTMVKGRHQPCPRDSSSSSISCAYAIVEDDNKELNESTENLFSFSTDKENDPTDISGKKHRGLHREKKEDQIPVASEEKEEANILLSCCGKRKKQKSSSSSSERNALACCGKRKKQKSSSNSSKRNVSACSKCKGEKQETLFACEIDKEDEMKILSISA